jgi:hypothetical protein
MNRFFMPPSFWCVYYLLTGWLIKIEDIDCLAPHTTQSVLGFHHCSPFLSPCLLPWLPVEQSRKGSRVFSVSVKIQSLISKRPLSKCALDFHLRFHHCSPFFDPCLLGACKSIIFRPPGKNCKHYPCIYKRTLQIRFTTLYFI